MAPRFLFEEQYFFSHPLNSQTGNSEPAVERIIILNSQSIYQAKMQMLSDEYISTALELQRAFSGTCWANWGRVKPPLFFRSENSCSDMRRIITMVPALFYKSYTRILHNCMIVMATIKMELSFFKLHTSHTGLSTYICSSTLPRVAFQKVLCLSYRCLGAR